MAFKNDRNTACIVPKLIACIDVFDESIQSIQSIQSATSSVLHPRSSRTFRMVVV